MTFREDLEFGQRFELEAMDLLNARLFPGWAKNPEERGVDLVHPLWHGGCECKFDREAERTGNFFFEFRFRGNPSGVDKYPCTLWAQGCASGCLLFNRHILREGLFELWRAGSARKLSGGDGMESEGLLARVSDVVPLAFAGGLAKCEKW